MGIETKQIDSSDNSTTSSAPIIATKQCRNPTRGFPWPYLILKETRSKNGQVTDSCFSKKRYTCKEEIQPTTSHCGMSFEKTSSECGAILPKPKEPT